MTNAEARFNNSLRPRKPEGSLGRTAQDVHLDSHTAPELCLDICRFFCFYSIFFFLFFSSFSFNVWICRLHLGRPLHPCPPSSSPLTTHAPSPPLRPPPPPSDVYRYKHAHLRQWKFAAAIRRLWQPLKRMLDYFLCCSCKCKNVAIDYSPSAASCSLQRQNFCSCRSAALELCEQRLQQMYIAAFHVAASKVNVSSNCALE